MTDTITGTVSLMVAALDEIGVIARSAIAKTGLKIDPVTVLRVIAEIYDSVRRAHNRRISPEEARDEIDRLVERLRDNDSAADAALHDRFGSGLK